MRAFSVLVAFVLAPAAPIRYAPSSPRLVRAGVGRAGHVSLQQPSWSAAETDPALLFVDQIASAAPCLVPNIHSVRADPEALATLDASDEQLKLVTSYLRPSAQQSVRLALEVSLLAHHGQRRRSGEPYVTHPVEVACILAQSQMEKVTLISGLLHDTVEDTDLTFHEIERLFGVVVRKIVEGGAHAAARFRDPSACALPPTLVWPTPCLPHVSRIRASRDTCSAPCGRGPQLGALGCRSRTHVSSQPP